VDELRVGHDVFDGHLLLNERLTTTRLGNHPLDAQLGVDGAKLSLPPKHNLIGSKCDEGRGTVRPERYEDVPLVARLPQRSDDAPRHVDSATPAVDEQVELLDVTNLSQVRIHWAHGVVSDLCRSRGTVGRDVGEEAAAARILDLLD
jgi:hypothetical protein